MKSGASSMISLAEVTSHTEVAYPIPMDSAYFFSSACCSWLNSKILAVGTIGGSVGIIGYGMGSIVLVGREELAVVPLLELGVVGLTVLG